MQYNNVFEGICQAIKINRDNLMIFCGQRRMEIKSSSAACNRAENGYTTEAKNYVECV